MSLQSELKCFECWRLDWSLHDVWTITLTQCSTIEYLDQEFNSIYLYSTCMWNPTGKLLATGTGWSWWLKIDPTGHEVYSKVKTEDFRCLVSVKLGVTRVTTSREMLVLFWNAALRNHHSILERRSGGLISFGLTKFLFQVPDNSKLFADSWEW